MGLRVVYILGIMFLPDAWLFDTVSDYIHVCIVENPGYFYLSQEITIMYAPNCATYGSSGLF